MKGQHCVVDRIRADMCIAPEKPTFYDFSPRKNKNNRLIETVFCICKLYADAGLKK